MPLPQNQILLRPHYQSPHEPAFTGSLHNLPCSCAANGLVARSGRQRIIVSTIDGRFHSVLAETAHTGWCGENSWRMDSSLASILTDWFGDGALPVTYRSWQGSILSARLTIKESALVVSHHSLVEAFIDGESTIIGFDYPQD